MEYKARPRILLHLFSAGSSCVNIKKSIAKIDENQALL